MPNDKVIYTDITFQEASGYNEDCSLKSEEEIKYPNEQFLINQLGSVDEIVVGGFQYSDCVRRVAECCLQNNMDTLVDLDLTDLFYALYYQQDYFQKESYNPQRYKEFWIKRENRYNEKIEVLENQFQYMYDSPVYKFDSEEILENKR